MGESPMPIGSCSKGRQKIYGDRFNIADSDGRVTGNDVTKFFAMSQLSRQELKQIWAIADSKRQGVLGLTEFIVAMQVQREFHLPAGDFPSVEHYKEVMNNYIIDKLKNSNLT